MSDRSDLLLWSALALALGLTAFALARVDLDRLARLRAVLADFSWLVRLRAAVTDLGWLVRRRAAFADLSRLARTRAAVAERIQLARGRPAVAERIQLARARVAVAGRIRLTRLRAAVSKWIQLARVRAALMADSRWLARLRAAAADLGLRVRAALARVRAALASAHSAVLRLRAGLRPQLPSPPVQLDRPLAALAPVKLPPVQRRPRVPGECEHPIVLAHGWMAVDAFSLPGMRQEYFRGVREQLRAHGHRVYVSRVSPLAGVRRRAEQLAEQLDKIDADKVNIIAHSMGGLDARYAISRFGLAERVASLTTIGTPHRGTPLADASLVLRDMPLLARALRSQLGLDLDALHDLTTAQMAEFNAAVPDMQGVRYTSYIGCVRGGVRDVHTLLAPGFAFLKRRTGDNDGIVPATSQRWGDVVGEVRADHWAQIGWSQGLDVKRFYAAIARLLARSGL